MRKLLATTTLVLSLAACQNERGATAESAGNAAAQQAGAQLTPEQLGELGAKIRRSPDQAQSLLAERGLTMESFEAQIRAVTENAEASKRYSASYAAATRTASR